MVKQDSNKVQNIERFLFHEIRDMVPSYKDSNLLSVGEPDFSSPPHIIKVGKEEIDQVLLTTQATKDC